MPEDRAKQIKLWLQDPAAQVFVNWLSNQCAALAAEAGNQLVDGGESDEADAKATAEKARQYLSAFEIMAKVIPKDFKFQIVTFREKPLSTQE
jgi:hypothetical protein